MTDRIADALRRAHSDGLANTTIEVFEPTVDYAAGDGFDVTYPDSPTTTYDARVDSPSSSSDRQRSGTTSEVDAIVRVRDDTGQQWTEFGEDGDAPTRLRDTADGRVYEVKAVTDPHNGTLQLDVQEVDQT